MTLSRESRIFSRLLNPDIYAPPHSVYLILSENTSEPRFTFQGRMWLDEEHYSVSYFMLFSTPVDIGHATY